MRKSLLFLCAIMPTVGIFPAFAEVSEIQLDETSYTVGELINVSGKVTEGSSGLVTIVLRDPIDRFVLLSQATIQSNKFFEKNISVNEKFQMFGNYNVTAFVFNVTSGKSQSFELVENISNNNKNSGVSTNKFTEPTTVREETTNQVSKVMSESKSSYDGIKNEVIDKLQNNVNVESKIAEFVDPLKDPQHYLIRYYNEPDYKLWFDKNYPNLSIEEAVGATLSNEVSEDKPNEGSITGIISTAKASLSVPSTEIEENDDMVYTTFLLGGVIILFVAVFGVRRRADGNFRTNFLSKNTLRNKIIFPIFSGKYVEIIKMRLAKGEITIEEFERIKEKLENTE